MKGVMRYLIALMLLMLFFSERLFSQGETNSKFRLVFEEIRSDDYSSPGIVEAIEQDTFGFIWLGAKDGLSRYDGVRFHNYLYNKPDTSSLSSNIIRDLFLDSRGDLWIGTENGLNLYNAKDDNFTRYVAGKSNSDGLCDNNIRKIAEDRHGNLWVATYGGGIVKLVPGENGFTPLDRLLKGGKELLKGKVHTLYIDRENVVWIGTAGQGVMYFNADERILKRLSSGPPDGKHLYGSEVLAFAEDSRGTIWIGTNGSGLNAYSRDSQSFTYFSTSQKGSNHISCDIVSSLTVDTKGVLWICTDGGGLNRLDPANGEIQNYRFSLSNPLTISSDVVRELFVDNAGNLWIGNFNAPVNFVNLQNKKFYTLKDILPLREAPNQNNITAVLCTGEKSLWLATDGDGLLHYSILTGKYTHYRNIPGMAGSLPNNKPVCLETDAAGNIWIGHFEGGLSCLRAGMNRFLHFYPDGSEESLSSTQVWDLYRYGDTLWIAGNGGLDYLDLRTGKFRKMAFTGSGTSFEHHGVWFVTRDSRNRLLIGTYNGLFVYDLNLHQLRHFLPDQSNPHSLSDKWILTIHEDSEKRIWIGTNGGGLDLWKEPDQFVCHSTSSGLAGNSIHAIVEDDKKSLWVSTNRGLCKIDPSGMQMVPYSNGDGLWGNRLNPHSACRSADGTLYFGGNNGLLFFKPDEIVDNPVVPRVVITGLEVFGKPSRKNNRNSLSPRNILFSESIRLDPGQKMFTLYFASLNYAQAERNQYKYRMDGYEDEWNMVGSRSWATYTNLRPGRYTFHVTGSNQDGVWNPQGTSLRVVILPPFYRTLWFIVLLTGVIVAIIYILYRHKIYQINKLNSRLSELVAARTVELEQRNLEIAEQHERIIKQRDVATAQRDHIIRINEELEKHRSRLEELVEERTQDLVIARDRAERGDRLKTAFLENLSSQIRSPLNAIIGFVNLLSDRIDDLTCRGYYLKIINESGKSLMGLIQDIIDFSRVQTGNLQPEYSECRINELIRDLISSARSRASREKPKLSIVADLPDEELLMYTDSKKLVQIFSKLLENAITFTDEGNVTLGIQEINDKWITFFVRDTGTALKPERPDDVFDLVYSGLDNDREGSSRRGSLGLAFAKVVTELLGGKIWTENTAGEGACFCFSLPFRQVISESHRHPQKENKFSWPGKKILIAEDEQSNYLLVEAILKGTGLTLIHCADGVQLLEKVDVGQEYDLVLLDLKMPRMGGINALKLIRESNPHVPVIIQTAYDQEFHRSQCLALGCTDFLVKPLRKKELLEAIDKYLKR